jgi:hypothetical protein
MWYGKRGWLQKREVFPSEVLIRNQYSVLCSYPTIIS